MLPGGERLPGAVQDDGKRCVAIWRRYRLSHIYAFDDVRDARGSSTSHDDDYVTTSIQAGDRLGYADMRDSNDFDVAVLLTQPDGERVWISYFALMPDGLFARYAARGVTRALLEISKAQREADPITSWGGRNDDDWIALGAPVPIGGALPLALALTATALAGLRRHDRS